MGWRPHRARGAAADERNAASFLLRESASDDPLPRSALPAGPPPEVQDEIDAAWERAQALVDGAYELRFGSDPALRRAWGELSWRDGTAALRLTAAEALAIACGDPVALPV